LTVTVTDSKVDAEITVTIDVTAADGTADTVVDAEIMVTITVTDAVNEAPAFASSETGKRRTDVRGCCPC
jgi:hypothetical protein